MHSILLISLTQEWGTSFLTDFHTSQFRILINNWRLKITEMYIINRECYRCLHSKGGWGKNSQDNFTRWRDKCDKQLSKLDIYCALYLFYTSLRSRFISVVDMSASEWLWLDQSGFFQFLFLTSFCRDWIFLGNLRRTQKRLMINIDSYNSESRLM